MYKQIEQDRKYQQEKEKNYTRINLCLAGILTIYAIGLYAKEYYPTIKKEITTIEGELEKIIRRCK